MFGKKKLEIPVALYNNNNHIAAYMYQDKI